MTHPAPLRSYPPPPERRSGGRAASFSFGLVGALVAAAVTMLRTGSTVLGIIIAVLVMTIGLIGAFGRSAVVARSVPIGLLVLTVGGGWWITTTALGLYRAFAFTDGPADPADTAALAAAQAKIAAFDADGAFRLELSEREIEAVIQDGLSGARSPLARIAIDIVDGDPDGALTFAGDFKNGQMSVTGTVTARLVDGAVEVQVTGIDFGSVKLPGLADGAIADLVASVADLNAALADNRADVQSISVGDDRIVVTGTQGGGTLITSAALLADLRNQAAAAAATLPAPVERLGPGVVDGVSAPGAVFYVALGDSLAANVGVDRPRDGYVSRVHNQLQIRDGREYGLRNFGVSGETSGTLIRSGQLDAAVAFLTANPVAYVTIDIGANDLLGHLGSIDCDVDLAAPACARRIADSFDAYRQNLPVILNRLRQAAPGATLVFMRAYNPFSFGFSGVAFERDSTAILDAFNEVAAEIAIAHGFLVADAFTPMLGTTATTTHMLANPPDIHPRPIGHDILASAIIDALG